MERMTARTGYWKVGLALRLIASVRDRFRRMQPSSFALFVGVIAAVVSAIGLYQRGGYAGDFTWAWRAARLWIQGRDPYNDPGLAPIFPYPFDAPLLYPMTAVVLAAPFAALPAWLAGSAFFGISTGILAYLVLLRREWRLLPLFISAPFYVAASVAQWSPLVVATALAPSIGFLALAKPNIGVPVLATHGRPGTWWRALTFVLLTLPLLPWWPLAWVENLRTQRGYPSPFLVFLGALVLLALLRWRAPEARLLVLMALVPQRLWFYDQLAVWLIARTWRQGLFLSALSWIGYVGWRMSPNPYGWVGSSPATAPIWVVCFIYVPALLLVLWPLVQPTAERLVTGVLARLLSWLAWSPVTRGER